ncbi:MAG: site-specific DNA-methyltransferase [Clostridium sp.]|nr:site-specific DNA-methyltransferase [Clostridium sp.]
MEIIYDNNNGKIIHGDNVDVLTELDKTSVDSCISDFPYAIEFMGKNWDFNNNFYDWCFKRAELLFKVLKPGGYAAIFGHPKTNHRMKCAFEDVGFKIVEEIDWIYSTGMPKNQDIGKLFDKSGNKAAADKYGGYKTAGLKPAHEPITIFQKPLEGTYIQNIEKYGCGAMNIDACRVPFQSEQDIQTAKAKTNFTEASDHSRGFGNGTDIYGDGTTPLEQAKCCIKDSGRFPPNLILDEGTAEMLDEQTGLTKSTGGSGELSRTGRAKRVYGAYQDKTNANYINDSLGGYGDTGGGSRYFPIIKYCPKVSPNERKLPDGERNPHVTVKPIELIKWLIKLLTPIDGTTIDITAGSCTHAVACEELNRDSGYHLKWIDIELMNTETDPYCNVGTQRVKAVNCGKPKKLF